MNRLLPIFLGFFVLVSCNGKSSPKTNVAEVSGPVITNLDGLKTSALGKNITISGKAPDIIYEHPVLFIPVDDKKMNKSMEYSYLDLADGYQLTIYSKDKIPCTAKAVISGRLEEVSGLNKGGEEFSEFYLIAGKWECME
ncbi:MAG: hypothetical protein A2Y33_06485 [Spirochaetes bacterium GWF1_51_8]|nr:MAG: hypothetical protein A2Y33_06485 [Spirochaetes bacterium GWF1_51_8]